MWLHCYFYQFYWVYTFNFCALKVMLAWNQEEKKYFRYTESRQGWKITEKWIVIRIRSKALRVSWEATQSKCNRMVSKKKIYHWCTAAPRPPSHCRCVFSLNRPPPSRPLLGGALSSEESMLTAIWPSRWPSVLFDLAANWYGCILQIMGIMETVNAELQATGCVFQGVTKF